MLGKEICVITALVFFATGCIDGNGLEKIRFSVVDLRDAMEDDICAVRFSSLSRFVKVPLVTYVAEPCACMLSNVYAQECRDGTELGTIRVVAQAKSRFSKLVDLCKLEKVGSDLTVAVTVYGRNAYPRAYLIDKECYLKIISLWECRSLHPNEILSHRSSHCHNGCDGRAVDFDGLCAIVGSDEYSLLAVFPNDDYLTVDVYGDYGALCERSFYRTIGHFFHRHDGSERFLDHLKTHLNSWEGKDSSVRIVLW